jgi:subtilisin family serine protease
LTTICGVRTKIATLLAVALSSTGLTLASPADAAPLLKVDDAVPGQYIVVLKRGVSLSNAVEKGDVLARYSRVLNGFAARLSAKQLTAVRSDPSVAYVQPDSIVTAATDQVSPPWGLDRIDQRLRPTNNVYTYDSTGAGVTLFVIDSGIRATHADFGGRAQGVYDAVGDGNGTNDCNGHGTHVAGIAGSTTHGVAKGVQIRAVRVLGCDNTGLGSDTIEGMEFVAANHPARSVVNISIRSFNPATNTAAEGLINSGVHVVIAAGNDSADRPVHQGRVARPRLDHAEPLAVGRSGQHPTGHDAADGSRHADAGHRGRRQRAVLLDGVDR